MSSVRALTSAGLLFLWHIPLAMGHTAGFGFEYLMEESAEEPNYKDPCKAGRCNFCAITWAEMSPCNLIVTCVVRSGIKLYIYSKLL